MPKQLDLLYIIRSFQAFGGVPLKALDVAEILTEQEINAMRQTLIKMANHYSETLESSLVQQDLVVLGNKIKSELHY